MRTHVISLLILLVLSAGACAQTAPRNPTDQAGVSVSVFVTDAHGNAVSSLSDGDLSIQDEHKPPRTVISVKHDTSPLRLGVLIDKSNSQRQSELYKAGVQELNAFLKQALRRETDKTFIETFDTVPDTPSAWMATNELGQARINLQPEGASSLFDAIALACKERFSDNRPLGRRVLILLTDGGDNQSRIGLDAAIAAALRAKAAIIAISTREEGNAYQQRGTDGVLKKLADNTGGYAFLELRPKDMQKVFSQILNKLDGMFEVVFIPAEPPSSREPRLLQVKSVSGKKLQVQAPRQYYATTPW